MKRILIFGENSYIGTHFLEYLKDDDNYIIDTIDSKGTEWRKYDFSRYDVVYHVAGIAHVSSNPKMEEIYYKINRDLPIEVAQKAKNENVKQFIFMSSMIIYGKDGEIGQKKNITATTDANPSDFYGKSKWEADVAIQNMKSNNFKPVVIRTPMVYGRNCKGNFPKLIKLAKYTFIFPNIENQRSMIYIENLCQFLKQIIDNECVGIFYPQNKEYVSTKDIIMQIAKITRKKIIFTKIFNPLLKLLSKKISYINKIFGNKTYDKNTSRDYQYCIVDFEESIRRSIEK